MHFAFFWIKILFMKIGVVNLRSRVQTGKEIYRCARNYYRDLGSKLDTTLETFFNWVRSIPYREDNFYSEVVGRPKHLLRFPALDCKKKAVLMGAWFTAHGIPWRLVAVSEKADKEVHHVFTQAKINKTWKTADPTYPEYQLFEAKPTVTYAEVLPG